MSSKFKWTRCAFQVLREKEKKEKCTCRGQLGMWKVPQRWLSLPLQQPWHLHSTAATTQVPVYGIPCADSDCLWFLCWGPCTDLHCPVLPSGEAFVLLVAKQGTGFVYFTQACSGHSLFDPSGNKIWLLLIRLEHWNGTLAKEKKEFFFLLYNKKFWNILKHHKFQTVTSSKSHL